MSVSTISVHQLRGMMDRPDGRFRLVDVREPDEWQLCRIDGAELIPMSQIDRRWVELNPVEEIVLYCHHGVRSRKVGELLVRRGFARVLSLVGGIDAWSLEIDPAVPRY